MRARFDAANRALAGSNVRRHVIRNPGSLLPRSTFILHPCFLSPVAYGEGLARYFAQKSWSVPGFSNVKGELSAATIRREQG